MEEGVYYGIREIGYEFSRCGGGRISVVVSVVMGRWGCFGTMEGVYYGGGLQGWVSGLSWMVAVMGI